MQNVCILGAGIRGRVVADLIHWQFSEEYQIAGYFDDRQFPGNMGPSGYLVLGTIKEGVAYLKKNKLSGFVALGTKASAVGWNLYKTLVSQDVSVASFVSPQAFVSPSARIGGNALIFPGVYIGCEVSIGSMLCAHGGVVIEHDSAAGDNVVMGPGVHIASKVKIGSHAFLGTGCQIAPEVQIGEGSVIGAGSVVVKDIPPHVVAYGQPARPRRDVREGDEVPLKIDNW